ncbi:MAG: hypothetical protein RL026_2342 [Pseudomonadota bacterium]|jgi:hypothetical protein
MSALIQPARLLLGAWLLAQGINHFVLPLWALPTSDNALATQLLAAFSHSGLLGVAMALQGVAGLLLLTGIWIPAALCVVMPVSTCTLYWALFLDRSPGTAALAVVVFALNGLLMLAWLDHYRGALQRHAPACGES